MNREPTGNTCGDIDGIIAGINSAIEFCDQGSEPEIEDLIDALHDIEHGLYGLEDSLEQLRTANGKLRDWGHEEAKEVDRLEEELSETKGREDQLEGSVEQLKDEVKCLDDEINDLRNEVVAVQEMAA